MEIQLKYEKPYGVRYDCYYNHAKVKKKFCTELPASGTLFLIEKNIFLSKSWWVIAIFNLACGLMGSFDDWKEERTKQRIIAVNYQNVLRDKLTFEILDKGQNVILYGVEKFFVDKVIEEENPVIIKRMKIAQKMLIIIPLTIVAIIFVVLAVCLI